MKVIDSILKKDIKKIVDLEQGPVYIFDQFIITEFNEGITVDEECFLKLYEILDASSRKKENFGFISNRIHCYSVNIFDFLKVSKLADRYYPTAFVVNTENMKSILSYEQKMYNTKLPTFIDINAAAIWMSSAFKKR